MEVNLEKKEQSSNNQPVSNVTIFCNILLFSQTSPEKDAAQQNLFYSLDDGNKPNLSKVDKGQLEAADFPKKSKSSVYMQYNKELNDILSMDVIGEAMED